MAISHRIVDSVEEETRMRTGNLFSACLVIAAAVGWLLLGWHQPEGRDDEIEYQGQHFKLTRAYASYDDYKQDPNNIDPAEDARVEQAVAGARIGRSYPTIEDVSTAVSDIQFPGYGLTSFGAAANSGGTSLEGFAVEIPRANKDRVVVFRGDKNRYTLVDDFVTPSESGILQVREESGKLIYYALDGRQSLTHPLSDK
jgi:hypothetical protein